MNTSLKSLGIVALLCFSFYYTHQFAILMRQKDPIYETILMEQDANTLASVDAIIDGDYIIPGLIGKKVNVTKSFQNMKKVGAFLEPYIVYDEKQPDISIQTNTDKIIKRGNPYKMAIAFLVDETSNFIDYFEEMGMDYSVLVTTQTVKNNYLGEMINNDFQNYFEVERNLNHQKKNTNLCFLKTLDKSFCLKQKKMLVEETYELSNQTVSSISSKIESGSIFYVKNLDLKYLKLIIENAVYKGFSIVTVSDLISENR